MYLGLNVNLTVYHSDLHKRKKTGKKASRPFRGRRAYDSGREPILTSLNDKDQLISQRVRGGKIEYKLKTAAHANVSTERGKVLRTEILEVVSNPANELYQRRGIITKGTVIKTPLGLVTVTSKPGADSTINAIIIKDVTNET